MTPDRPSQTRLFRAEGTQAVPAHPALLGGRCRSCGAVFFPMQAHGCEHCGSTDLVEHALGGRGRLVTLATVHLHASPDRAAPFTVGSVVTDDGAVVRALLDTDAVASLRPGDTVVTRLVPETRPGRGAHDLRFTKA